MESSDNLAIFAIQNVEAKNNKATEIQKMSYDLMVLDKHERFKSSDDFLKWYDEVTEWSDDIDYHDYRHATPNLQSWFLDIKDIIRPMNGEFAPSDEEMNNNSIHTADYSIGSNCIYIGFAWTDAEQAYSLVKELAKKYNLIFFDISGYNQLIYPDGFVLKVQPKSQEDIETEFVKEFKAKVPESFAQQPSLETFQKERKHRSWIANCIVVACCLLFVCVSYILLQLGCFKSVMPFFSPIFIAVLLLLVYYIHKWEQKADDDIRNKYMAELSHNNLKGYSIMIPVVKNKQELLQQLAYQLHFPDYFGFNWDALLELFQDFSWISEKNVIIAHKDISCLSQKDYAKYKEIVNETIHFWKSRTEHNVYFIFEGESRL